MNLKEKANQYAIGKAEEAASQAIASAYIAGYEMGYEDGLAKLSYEDIEKSDYVDLGLPSGTLWSKEYVKLDGKTAYMAFTDAKKYNLPSEEQWLELLENCEYSVSLLYNTDNVSSAKFVGPSGESLYLRNVGRYEIDFIERPRDIFIFLDNESENNKVKAGYIKRADCWNNEIEDIFVGYRLPILTVKSK